MQRIIQITIGGRVIPIEEQAYAALNDYIRSLERQFANEEGKNDIIQDIENRIAELFAMKLDNGGQAIETDDIKKVIETLGHAEQLDADVEEEQQRRQYSHTHYTFQEPRRRRLYRNPNDKMLGGVCSGLANYFDIDTVIVRLVFAILFLTMGVGVLAYIIAWIIIPVAKTPQEMYYMTGVPPVDFNTIKKNMEYELQDLKKKAEQMSQELKDFFSRKK